MREALSGGGAAKQATQRPSTTSAFAMTKASAFKEMPNRRFRSKKRSTDVRSEKGVLLRAGLLRAKDPHQAFEWFLKAAEQAMPRRRKIGRLLPLRTEQNYRKAFHWYSKSALQGHIDAQIELGDRFFYGQGVLQTTSRHFSGI